MRRRGSQRQAFTLVELLISISIIGILLALVIPNIDRSLSGNDLANDAEIFKSKVEETRLLASSTQQVDSGANDAGAYYGVYLPSDPNKRFYTIVRVTASGTCPASAVVMASNDPTQSQVCIVQRIALSRKVTFETVTEQLILFRVPTQQTFKAVSSSSPAWKADTPNFSAGAVLKYDTKRATLNIEAYTAKVTITYN